MTESKYVTFVPKKICNKKHSLSEKMIENIIDKFIGNFCKIVIKVPNDEKARVVTGFIIDVDRESGIVKIETKKGLNSIDIKKIVAIKPK